MKMRNAATSGRFSIRHISRNNPRSVLTLAAAATLGLLAQSSRAAVTDTWTGAVNGNWDTATANWSNGGSGVYADGDTAIFSGGANTDLTVQAAGVSPASITFQSTAANYSFTNASGTTGIAGTSTLTLASTYTGTVALASANTYTGATTVSGGTLELQNVNALAGSALTIGNGGSLSLRADADTTFAPASFTGPAAGQSYSMAVSSLTAGGSGKTLSIIAPNSSTGAASSTTLNVSSTSGDTLKFTTAFKTNSNSGAAFTASSNNVFNLTNANVILDAGVSMGNNGDGGIALNSSTGNSLTINGVVTTNTNRTTAGIVNSGTLVLNNTVAPNGTNQGFFVYLNGGTLDIHNAGAVRNNSAIVAAQNRAGLVLNGGTLDNTSGAAIALQYNPTVLLNGDFAFSTTGSTSANSLNLGTGAVSLGAAAATGTTRTITTNGAATLTIGGAISNGNNGTADTIINVVKAGTGTLAFNGAAGYTGTTTVQAGTLKLGSAGTLNSSTRVNLSAGASFDTTAKSSYAMLGTQTFNFTLDPTGAGSAGLLAAAGLDITAGAVDFSTLGTLDDHAYVLANYSSLTGSAFNSVSDLPANYQLDYAYNGGTQIALVAVPEPLSGGALALLGMAGLLRRRRRDA